jgi:ABC-type multidrug transport system fused ATPase/permease subunit
MVLPESGKEEQGENPSRIAGELKFEHVTFSYVTGEPVLRDVTFTVSPGQVAALIGPSGVGKSTLISLILKFYLPQSGAVLLDGHDIREISSEWLRQKIGIVSQETFLFHDTIEKNIRYGNPDASRPEVEEAAKRAHIHDEIEAFPQQYQTIVGERGARLSAGQRQRLSIARAFLKNPPILILDEPTSALAEDAEKGIRESLKELAANRTTFIISHREALVELADRVLVLDNGELSYQERQ